MLRKVTVVLVVHELLCLELGQHHLVRGRGRGRGTLWPVLVSEY